MSLSNPQFVIPDEIASPQTKLVYMSLLVADEPKATDLQGLLGLSKLTLFAVLESLTANELVRRTEAGYVVR
ncbi:transcription initiation factor IIE, alpha subunit [Natrinema ejinorense]|uniref:Transcription initiation factor IIE, alpha subunit n=1 Tax=Natrinema ejinorense TaxID=373386 RepID=A0A2A5R167_9EURY|nr:transcription initiation factor IIE, alpha subunit [Natrinema ejinorense]